MVYELRGINQQLFHSTMVFQKKTNYFTLASDKHSKMTTELTRQTRSTGHNRRLAQWGVKWLIEHSISHQLLWCIDSIVLRNSPQRQAENRQVVKKLRFA